MFFDFIKRDIASMHRETLNGKIFKNLDKVLYHVLPGNASV
jgi:hypothetical protein